VIITALDPFRYAFGVTSSAVGTLRNPAAFSAAPLVGWRPAETPKIIGRPHARAAIPFWKRRRSRRRDGGGFFAWLV
jgi:hypothetical protein